MGAVAKELLSFVLRWKHALVPFPEWLETVAANEPSSLSVARRAVEAIEARQRRWIRVLPAWRDESLPPCTQTLTGHEGHVTCVAVSADGRRLVSGSGDKVNGTRVNGKFTKFRGPRIRTQLKLWDRQTGACLQTFTGHTDVVRCVAISADGSFVASAGSFDNTVKLWDAASGEATSKNRTGHTGDVCSVAISADGLFVASDQGPHGAHEQGRIRRDLRRWVVRGVRQSGQDRQAVGRGERRGEQGPHGAYGLGLLRRDLRRRFVRRLSERWPVRSSYGMSSGWAREYTRTHTH